MQVVKIKKTEVQKKLDPKWGHATFSYLRMLQRMQNVASYDMLQGMLWDMCQDLTGNAQLNVSENLPRKGIFLMSEPIKMEVKAIDKVHTQSILLKTIFLNSFMKFILNKYLRWMYLKACMGGIIELPSSFAPGQP